VFWGREQKAWSSPQGEGGILLTGAFRGERRRKPSLFLKETEVIEEGLRVTLNQEVFQLQTGVTGGG